MCGRYRVSRTKQVLEQYFDTAPWEEDWIPRYNVAPTQPVPVIRRHPNDGSRQMSTMKWGLVPYWAKSASVGASTINAKSETAATKPAFRDPLKFRRCLIPADGFYEWKKLGKNKKPYCFEVNRGQLFAFAGLWDGWRDASGQWLKTCSILTTTPNAMTSPVHNRMPVILDPGSYDVWLDPQMQDALAATELLKPYDHRQMRCYPVSDRVNYVGNDDEACSRAAKPEFENPLFAQLPSR